MAASFDLSGKTALVTGSRRGIGQAIAHALAKAGADIVGISANQEEHGSEVEQMVQSAGRRFTGRAQDLSDRTETYELVDWLRDSNLSIDILVNNAGAIRRSPADQHADEDWDYVLELNLSAPFLLARELGKTMVERGSGKIIFISSILGFQGGVTVPSYTSTKTALLGLTRALANEWAESGVNVNAIAPGYMSTDITQRLRDDQDRYAGILSRIPAARWGTPEDLGGAAVFLSSDASAYVHGTVLPVDGGWLGR